MKSENFWNVFVTSGDPLAYVLYNKTLKSAQKTNLEKQTKKQPEQNRYI